MIGRNISRNQALNDAPISNQGRPAENVRLIFLKIGVKKILRICQERIWILAGIGYSAFYHWQV
jgi:hypothetical protein